MSRRLLAVVLSLWICGPASAQLAPNPPSSLGPIVSNFGGLQFALAQGGLGTPSGTMTGYAQYDTIVLQCPGVTFAVPPSVGVVGVNSGAVTQAVVNNPGATTGPVPSGSVACKQSSTTGSGAGYQVTVQLGVIAATLSVPQLLAGGSNSANENFLLNWEQGDTTPSQLAGAEDVFVGPGSGRWTGANSSYNTGVGSSSCGGRTGAYFSGADNTCLGNDAGRNMTNVSGAVLLGQGAGRNLAAAYSTFVGFQAGGSNGANSTGAVTGIANSLFGFNTGASISTSIGNTLIGFNSGDTLVSGGYNSVVGGNTMTAATTAGENAGIGYQILTGCTTCSGVTALGTKAAQAITTGTNDVIIQATTGGDNCSNGNESNVVAVCAGAGRVLTITGTGTPGTSIATHAGTVGTAGYAIASLPACGAGLTGQFAYVTNGVASPAYMGAVSATGSSVDPVFCNGSSWVYH